MCRGNTQRLLQYLKRALEMRQALPDVKPTLVGVTAENLGENYDESQASCGGRISIPTGAHLLQK
jgi:hypothetical protein